MIAGVIDVNGIRIINGVVPWFVEAMQDRIDKATNYDPLRTFSILGRNIEAAVINELFDLIANQNMPDSGLEDIYLRNFENVGDLDGTVLDRLVEECSNLKKLTVTNMAPKSSDHNREELTLLINKILELRPPLTHLDLYYFSEKE